VRVLGTGTSHGDYADIYAAQWLGHLRNVLSAECLKLGLTDLAVLQQGQPRRLTQRASLEIYKTGLSGIYYRSRYGHDLENIGPSLNPLIFRSQLAMRPLVREAPIS
jgi:hypothetical protein